MPFTFSHPAIVIPLKKWKPQLFSTTGLVIGSIIPDFEYFIRLSIKSTYSHTISGIFWFDLPFALLLSFLFHLYMRNPIITHLPQPYFERLQSFLSFDWKSFFSSHKLIVISSSFIGICSHLLWDAFTHQHGFFVQKLTFLEQSVSFFHFTFPLYKITQHLSTFIGGFFIFYWFLMLPKQPVAKPETGLFWTPVILVTLISVVLRMTFTSINLTAGNLLVNGISFGMLALFIRSMLEKSYKKTITTN